MMENIYKRAVKLEHDGKLCMSWSDGKSGKLKKRRKIDREKKILKIFFSYFSVVKDCRIMQSTDMMTLRTPARVHVAERMNIDLNVNTFKAD